MEFEQACRRLTATYEAGELVPFLGAGMSVPACADWPGFIRGLERRAEIAGADVDTDPAALIRRANRAVRTLKLRNHVAFPAAVEEALIGTRDGQLPQTLALAKTWWPLVLTTNYDVHFHAAFCAAHPSSRMVVRGRAPRDCQDVLSSLTAPADPILWALQGFLGDSATLSSELVIGHEEYRRVTYREQHFRKAFADVYRRRSLLFLGSGLKDSYLLELFGEILEFYGANPLYHYAFAKAGEVDVDFLLARFNTIVVEYAAHEDLPRMLNEFNAAVVGARPRAMRWDYALSSDGVDLSVVRGRLPDVRPRTKECIAISAGGDSHLFLSSEMQAYVMRAGALGHVGTVKPSRVADTNIWRFGRSPLFALMARQPGDVRDVRAISRTVRQFCTVAVDSGFRSCRMQLLSAGRGRSFPARFSLIEIVRGFVGWRREHPEEAFTLSVHLVAPDVLFDLTTGRVDLLELLTVDDIRFWIEIVLTNGEVERHLQHCSSDTPVRDLARRFDIPPDWQLDLNPAPQRERAPTAVDLVAAEETVESFGVVPGCALRFTQSP